MKAKIINDIKSKLIEENNYSSKDDLNLLLLENLFRENQKAYKDVQKNGSTIHYFDFNGKAQVKQNPSYKTWIETTKEIEKIQDTLLLTLKSRKSIKEQPNEKDNPIDRVLDELDSDEFIDELKTKKKK